MVHPVKEYCDCYDTLLLISLCLLRRQSRFSVEETGIESFRTDWINLSIDVLNQ
jgi:hypothetical protein